MHRTIKPAYIHIYTPQPLLCFLCLSKSVCPCVRLRLSVCPSTGVEKMSPSKYLPINPSSSGSIYRRPHLTIFSLPTMHWAWQAGQPTLTSR